LRIEKVHRKNHQKKRRGKRQGEEKGGDTGNGRTLLPRGSGNTFTGTETGSSKKEIGNQDPEGTTTKEEKREIVRGKMPAGQSAAWLKILANAKRRPCTPK